MKKENKPYLNVKIHGGDAHVILDYVEKLLDEIKKSNAADVFDFSILLEWKGNILEDIEK